MIINSKTILLLDELWLFHMLSLSVRQILKADAGRVKTIREGSGSSWVIGVIGVSSMLTRHQHWLMLKTVSDLFEISHKQYPTTHRQIPLPSLVWVYRVWTWGGRSVRVREKISGQANQRQSGAGHALAIVGHQSGQHDCYGGSSDDVCIIISHVLCMWACCRLSFEQWAFATRDVFFQGCWKQKRRLV